MLSYALLSHCFDETEEHPPHRVQLVPRAFRTLGGYLPRLAGGYGVKLHLAILHVCVGRWNTTPDPLTLAADTRVRSVGHESHDVG